MYSYMAYSRFASRQWETSLQSNAVSHWLGRNLESSSQVAGEALRVVVTIRTCHEQRNSRNLNRPDYIFFCCSTNVSGYGTRDTLETESWHDATIVAIGGTACKGSLVEVVISPSPPWTKWPPFWETTFSNAFTWLKMIEFLFKFHGNLFPRVQLTISQHWFK